MTVAVPSFNQAEFLDEALRSIFSQEIPVEVFVADGGSTDGSLNVIRSWSSRLSGWRSHPDAGQAAAINECIDLGTAPYVCWLNSDDWLLPGGLETLLEVLERKLESPAAYGKCVNFAQGTSKTKPVWVEPFNVDRLAIRCIISQPGTLIRRVAWNAVDGVNKELHMAMDYDLWWKLYLHGGPLAFTDRFVAANRDHPSTKTNRNRRLHYGEAMAIVKKYYGRIPLKWWLAQPYSVWLKSCL
ncbi:glycosyltransferase [Niveibacterium sp. SC-1]|uniref:glycosyltransferase n=1 Tax=Niveibacterium sp. SC-1 TaxID=3135646 RepID=UPI00311EA413